MSNCGPPTDIYSAGGFLHLFAVHRVEIRKRKRPNRFVFKASRRRETDSTTSRGGGGGLTPEDQPLPTANPDNTRKGGGFFCPL